MQLLSMVPRVTIIDSNLYNRLPLLNMIAVVTVIDRLHCIHRTVCMDTSRANGYTSHVPLISPYFCVCSVSSNTYNDVQVIYCRLPEDSKQVSPVYWIADFKLQVPSPPPLPPSLPPSPLRCWPPFSQCVLPSFSPVFLWFLWELLTSLLSVCRKGLSMAVSWRIAQHACSRVLMIVL